MINSWVRRTSCSDNQADTQEEQRYTSIPTLPKHDTCER